MTWERKACPRPMSDSFHHRNVIIAFYPRHLYLKTSAPNCMITIREKNLAIIYIVE